MVDLVPGDPKLALKEDLISKDWQDATGGNVRGLRTTFLFSEFLRRCKAYDFVLFDVGPSLGSINRAVLLGCDYFLSPMSIDIFSLKAIKNISSALREWKRRLEHGLTQIDKSLDAEDIPNLKSFDIKFAAMLHNNIFKKLPRMARNAR